MKSISLISAEEYPKQFLAAIKNANERIVLQSMHIEYGKHTKAVLEELVKAAKRGVRVIFLPDFYSYYYHERGARFGLRPIRRLRVYRNVRHLKKLIKEINRFGGRARFVHSLKSQKKFGWFPKAGRNHCKIAIADNKVFSFGGVNFSGKSFENHDFMFTLENKKLADVLYEYSNELFKRGRVNHDQKFEIDGLGTIIIDGGRPDDSPIFNETIRVANKADAALTYISQTLPGGKLDVLMHLKQHKLGKDKVKIATNRPRKMWLLLRAQQTLETLKSGLKVHYPIHGYIHAKMVIAYHKNGKRTAVTGSHNFNTGGVKLGTAELALFTENEEIIDQLEDFAERLFAQCNTKNRLL